jgi:hypothetical protein
VENIIIITINISFNAEIDDFKTEKFIYSVVGVLYSERHE